MTDPEVVHFDYIDRRKSIKTTQLISIEPGFGVKELNIDRRLSRMLDLLYVEV